MSDLYELPNGWEWKTIEEICEILDRLRKPISQKNRVSGEYPYYGATGIVDYVNDYIFDEKLLLIGEDGAKWGANENTAFIADGKYWVNNHAHIMRPNREKVLDMILVYYLNATNLMDYITGATVKKLNQQKLKSIKIPLPPLSEQKRIVSKLELLFEKIDRGVALHQKNMDDADLFMGSVLNDVFGELEEKYSKFTINEISTVKGGKRVPKGYKLSEKETPYPYLRVTDFTNNGTISKEKMLYLTEEIYQQIKRYTITDEDLYITNVGNTIGKSGIIPSDLNGANLTENAVKLVYKDKDNTSNKFMYYFTKSSVFISQMENATKQMAVPKLAIMRLGEIKIPHPPLNIQQKTVKYLDEVSQKTEKLKSIQKEKMESLIALKASILDKAFRGEL